MVQIAAVSEVVQPKLGAGVEHRVDAKNHIPSIPEVVKRKCCRNCSGAMGLVYSNSNGRQTYRAVTYR